MPRLPIILFVNLLPSILGAQTAPDMWWVEFTDKAATPYSIDQPEAFLSLRSIQRRQRQGVTVIEQDLPVDPAYIQQVLAAGQVTLHNRSKWFNAITIRTTDQDALDAIAALPFVSAVRGTRSSAGITPHQDKFPVAAPDASRTWDYGGSFLQISMMNGHLLHDLDASGQGMLIGVLDSGFDGTDSLSAFDALNARNGVVAAVDLVDHDGDVYQDHWHGRSVLSCMAGIVDGQLIGTAPLADYVLVRTENAATEYLVEEDDWIAGAEWCDSLGVDILNTSLGYTVFDDSTMDHIYSDLDGATLRISIAASIAAQKGMIPVTSAGNQGNDPWNYISAPADAFDILTVGAVGAEEQYAFFSSRGPSADGRVKPDVAAMGWGATGLGPDGQEVTLLNGTSFSAPLVSGLVACLWQLHPERTAMDIMDAVRRSASQYDAPDQELGYGIPDFQRAHELLSATTGMSSPAKDGVRIFPVPFSEHLTIVFPGSDEGTRLVEFLDISGRPLFSVRADARSGGITLSNGELGTLAPGFYLVRIDGEPLRTVVKGR
jgi:subtilisin family serine protease